MRSRRLACVRMRNHLPTIYRGSFKRFVHTVYVTLMDHRISTSDSDPEAFDEEDNVVVTEWKQLH